MTTLVHHSSPPELAGEPSTLRECFQQDLAFAKRVPTIPIIGKLVKPGIQLFYVRDLDVPCPEELKSKKFRDIHESSLHLPATTESLVRLKRLIDVYVGRCNFQRLEISEADHIIYYSIPTRP